MKRCSKCKETKAKSEFGRNKRAPDGLRWACKVCCKKQKRLWEEANPGKLKEYARRYRGKNHEKFKEGQRRNYKKNWLAYALRNSRADAERYGYEPCNATAEELKASFTGRCGICGVPELECSRRLAMDHCHETGEFRGWLCSKCNQALGLFRDSEDILVDALHYLMNCKVK